VGSLSYRFGGGTDLIGDTTAPIDGSGLVFAVNTNPDLDVGFNLWSNNNGSYTGFIAGNSPAVGQPIIYLGETGAVALTAVPEASTWAMMLAGFGGLGFAAFYRSRRSGVSAVAKAKASSDPAKAAFGRPFFGRVGIANTAKVPKSSARTI
jgi:hypothetical protein